MVDASSKDRSSGRNSEKRRIIYTFKDCELSKILMNA